MKKPYIFFDFDGTVLCTNDAIVESWNHTSEHYLGHGFPRETWEKTFGETIKYTAENFFPGVDPEEAIEIYRKYQEVNCADMVRLFDGIRELLDELKACGYKLALVTSRRRKSTWDYLEKFKLVDYFDVYVDCESTPAHKPDPEPLLVAIAEMSELVGREIDKSECIMLGDTRFDILCCKNAGVDSILVDWSHAIDEQQLEELGAVPTYRCAKPADVLEIV